jgi:hypothetical protein
MNALTTLSASLSTGSVEFAMTTKPNKKGEIKTGNIAHAFAFATATARKEISRDVYMAWLANGTYRPIIKAITAQLSGSAAVFANSLIGSGPVSCVGHHDRRYRQGTKGTEGLLLRAR